MISYRNRLKVVADFLAAFLLLSLLSPILIISTIGLYFVNDGSPFFFQIRPGQNEKLFRIIKYKTMTDERDAQGKLLSDAERLTRLGKLVRKSSVDELPQLLNVLKGDMSFVGPRPLLPEYLSLYTKNQARRHEVRPGITGWAQVNGRNSISWAKKFAYDVEYIDKLSFLFDVKILWLTVIKVLKRESVNQSDERPMQRFNGNN
ncbi:sugar transferase [Flagellimonas pacifica]|uniref:Sugar transferase involved in LPS biosynthesis (Colanic, teichoic acid) n=1 Tax=Flagellimonas pacifica TaxID=1247520 RepID=A0A285MVG0_9FLAO|nr:sugar transferase [Allomuricauda parva]SNZ01179.1 Sugar transferase involved in LPS biosynthesis (colanic, teichoic acid) [Allomuricauda parva]